MYPKHWFKNPEYHKKAEERGISDTEDEELTEHGKRAKYLSWHEGHEDMPKDKMKYITSKTKHQEKVIRGKVKYPAPAKADMKKYSPTAGDYEGRKNTHKFLD